MIDFKNASYVKLHATTESVADKILPMLTAGEEIVEVFKSIRDYVVFTNKRLITANVQGLTGKKVDYTTLPYNKIQSFSIETAGTIDLDSELELWFSGLGKVKLEFLVGVDIMKIGKCISDYSL